MRTLVAAVVVLAFAAGATALAQQPDADMGQLFRQYESAWNKADAKALAALYTQNALRIGADGVPVSGRAAIEQSFVKNFEGPWKGTKVMLKEGRTQNISADVRVTEGTYELSGTSSQRGRFLNTMTREGGQWRIAALAAIPAPAK